MLKYRAVVIVPTLAGEERFPLSVETNLQTVKANARKVMVFHEHLAARPELMHYEVYEIQETLVETVPFKCE